MSSISVVTVTYNAQERLPETIKSVLGQSFVDFEYLIVDGLSADDTVAIAESYRVAFAEKGINYRILSRKDSGIYNAMNQAARETTGDYILYLNAGDLFWNEDVLKNVRREMEREAADIYYGDMVFKTLGMYRYGKAASLSSMAEGIPFCHQSVFTAASLLRARPYDEQLKVCADHDFYAWAMVKGARFCAMSFPISIYEMGGASASDDSRGYWYEKLEVARRNGLISGLEYWDRKSNLDRWYRRRKWILFVKKNIPQKIHDRRHMMALVKDGWVPAAEMVSSEYCSAAVPRIKSLYRKLWTAVHGNRLNQKGCTFINYDAKIKRTRVFCSGKNNKVLIMPGCYLDNCTFHIQGDHNSVILWNDGVYINGDFWLEDNENRIICEEQVKLTGKIQLAATEGKRIHIGKDCLFSDEIIVRTGDSHSICDLFGQRINPAADVEVGAHVWVCHGVNILKGAKIPQGCVVGTASVIGKGSYGQNSVIAGNPGVVVKKGVIWNFER